MPVQAGAGSLLAQTMEATAHESPPPQQRKRRIFRIHESEEEDVALEDDEVAALEDADARGSAEAEGTQVPSMDANAGDSE